jgi:hypothetical protein
MQVGSDGDHLSVRDNGVGMTAEILTDYLLGIASDYWQLDLFAHDYPVAAKTFRPVGRFGIGFLSVFMVSERVDVETERLGGGRLRLRIQNVGRRGSLREEAATGNVGTTIRLTLKPGMATAFDELDTVVRRHAPMLEVPLLVRNGDTETRREPGWRKTAPFEQIAPLIFSGAMFPLFRLDIYIFSRTPRRLARVSEISPLAEHIDDNYRVAAILEQGAGGSVLVCSRGFAVTHFHLAGIAAILDAGDVELDAARAHAPEWRPDAFRARALLALRSKLLAEMDSMSTLPNLPSKMDRLAD